MMNNPSIPTQQQQMAQANSMGMMRPGQMDMGPGGPNGPMMGQMRPHMNPQMMMQMQSQQQQQHPMQMQGQRPPPPEYGKMMPHQVCIIEIYLRFFFEKYQFFIRNFFVAK